MPRRDGTPLWVSESTSQVSTLTRTNLQAGSGKYDEAWLQLLLHRNPDVLPIGQIEAEFGRLVPLCRELPLTFGGGKAGSLDNLFVTSGGGLVLVEAKLWRNPDARRTVVAQAMEYAAAVFRMNYEDLQSAVMRGRASEDAKFASLFEIAAHAEPGINEAEFVDAVSRNLKRGRAIIAVVGDGIREDIVPLAELLQTHAGHRFTFALIELAVYETPQSGVRLVIPSILAQTALIERGVVQIEESADLARRIVVREPSVTIAGSPRERSMGIGEDEYYELLDARVPGASSLVKQLLTKAEALGINADRQSGLNLKHASPKGNALNLGTIDKNGFVETGPATWWERTLVGRRYNETLASLIGGLVREAKNGKESSVRTSTGNMPRITDLLPKHERAWLNAMEKYVQEMFEDAEEK